MAVDQDKLNAFLGKAVGDIGAAMSANMVLLGDQLGFYKAMPRKGPVTPAELAKATKTAERYVREWLVHQAAGGYVTYDPATGRYTLPDEQAMALADENSPCFLPGAFQVIAAAFSANPKIEQRFKTGKSYAFVTHFDCLHDMGDPIGAAKHARETLASDGTWMIVEPFAGDRVEDNLNPVGRVSYAASTMICVPASLA